MLIDKNLLLANLRKNCIEDKLDMKSAAWVIKIIKDTPEAKGLEAICDLAYSLSPEHRKIKSKVDTYDMLDGMTFDQIKAYVWEYEKFANKLFDLVESYEEGN